MIRVVSVALVLVALLTGSASAECAWVLWKYQGMSYSPPLPVEAIDAFETRGACVQAIDGFATKYRAQNWHRIDRLNDTVLFAASGPLGENREEVQVTCRPDTIDPRGPKKQEIR